MMTLIWYPKCSTCQKAKKKLEELGASFETRDIVTQTPTAEELREWIRRGGLELRQLYNVSGRLYKELNMKERRLQMSEDEQLDLLSTACSSSVRCWSGKMAYWPAIAKRPMKRQ